MPRFTVRVSVDQAYRHAITAKLLRRWALVVLERLGLPDKAGVHIAITDDEKVRELNRVYRGLDEYTDVLSFAFTDLASPGPYYGDRPLASEDAAGFVVPSQEAYLLGEVIIALPYARRQADQAGHALQRELATLLVHGILHTLGYDHEREKDKRSMWDKTSELLELLA